MCQVLLADKEKAAKSCASALDACTSRNLYNLQEQERGQEQEQEDDEQEGKSYAPVYQ